MPVLRKARLIFTFFVLGLGCLFIFQHWQLYRNAPKNYEWNQVDAFLRAHAGLGDLLLFEPPWLAGYAQDFGRMGPFSVVSRRDLTKKTFPPSSKLWLITPISADRLKRELKERGLVVEQEQAIHSVRITPFQIPQTNILYDFDRHLAEAEVLLDFGDGKVEKGIWQEDQWVFSNNPEFWNRVGIRTEALRRQTRRCIWFHPQQNAIKRMSFSHVPLANKIQFYGGIVDSGLSTPPGTNVYLAISWNGQEVAILEFKDTDTKFDYSIDLADKLKSRDETGQVTFEVRSSHQTRRHFCFSAWAEA